MNFCFDLPVLPLGNRTELSHACLPNYATLPSINTTSCSNVTKLRCIHKQIIQRCFGRSTFASVPSHILDPHPDDLAHDGLRPQRTALAVACWHYTGEISAASFLPAFSCPVTDKFLPTGLRTRAGPKKYMCSIVSASPRQHRILRQLGSSSLLGEYRFNCRTAAQ